MSDSWADDPVEQQKPTELGGQIVPAEVSPVPAGPATLPIMFRVLPRQEADRLVLRVPSSTVIAMFVGALIALLVVAAALRVDRLFWAGWGRVELVSLLLPMLLTVTIVGWFVFRTLLLPRVTFDREAGLLVLGWCGLRGRRPLSSVVGVQVLRTNKRFGRPGVKIHTMAMYQLNLVLDNPAEPRLNVMSIMHVAVSTARDNARAIADFLGVPVLDSSGEPEGTVAAGAVAEAPMPAGGLATIPSPVLTEPDPDVLLIRPRRLAFFGDHWKSLLVHIAVVIGGVVFEVLGLNWGWDLSVHLGAALALTLMLSLSVFLTLLHFLGRGARFDRGRGLLTLGRKAPQPLAAVTAVQVVDRTECQLNLVLDDAQQPRLNLITDTDAAMVRKAAERVAYFLDVPLLEAKQPAAAMGPGAADGPNYLDEVNRSPLPAGSSSIHGPASVVRSGEDGLVLRPRLLVNWFSLAITVLVAGAWVFVSLVNIARAGWGLGNPTPWVVVGLCVSLFLFFLLKPLWQNRNRFDRHAELLTLGWFGRKGTHPLTKILAVQLIPAGLVQHGTRERVSYQMNLVMADVYQNRLNLTDDSDLEWTRRAGRQIADFLGVPLLDQIANGGSSDKCVQ